MTALFDDLGRRRASARVDGDSTLTAGIQVAEAVDGDDPSAVNAGGNRARRLRDARLIHGNLGTAGQDVEISRTVDRHRLHGLGLRDAVGHP